MVSIIISTYQSNYLEALKSNIENTIGVPYEIIAIENKRAMGICRAYNLGAAKANYPYLCFTHEDIEFKTPDWACNLLEQFETDKQTGLIGVAGTTYKSLAPGGWGNVSLETDRLQIIQHYKGNREPEYCNQTQQDFEQVVCADGVFLFTKKSIWQENKFDEHTFTDFHCYDLDFSLSINRNYKVFVTNQVLIEHFSPGGMDANWIKETIKLSEKWAKNLPIGFVDKSTQFDIEWKQKIWTLSKMIFYKNSISQIFRVYFGFGFFEFFSFQKSFVAIKMIIKHIIKNTLTPANNA